MQIDFKKIRRQDIVFSAVIILITASLLLLPSRLGGKGSSPGQSAFNALLLISQCTDEVYKKSDKAEMSFAIVIKYLLLERDFSGADFWQEHVAREYKK